MFHLLHFISTRSNMLQFGNKIYSSFRPTVNKSWLVELIQPVSYVFFLKFYCSTVMVICLHVVSGCICTVTALLSSCDRAHRACKTYSVFAGISYAELYCRLRKVLCIGEKHRGLLILWIINFKCLNIFCHSCLCIL